MMKMTPTRHMNESGKKEKKEQEGAIAEAEAHLWGSI
jgi:hypothetical protein